MKIYGKFIFDQEKKHSVLYRADKSKTDPCMTSIYVMKVAIRPPYPKVLGVTIEDLDGGK
jgi:hypothetical protein